MRKALRCSILGLFIFTVFTVGAQQHVDSLKNRLNDNLSDSSYIDVLNQLSKDIRYSEPVLAIDYAIKAEKLAERINHKSGLSRAYHNMGAIYADKRNNELALEYYNKSLNADKQYVDQHDVANTYGNIGLIYRRMRQFDKALEYHNKSLEIKIQLNDSMGIAYSYGNIGLVYTEQGKYDKALIHFYKSLRIKESLNDKYGMANSYGNIGIIYLKISSYDQAKISLERSLQLFEEIENKTGIAISLLHLGDIYFKQNNQNLAIDAFKRSLKIYIEQGNIKGIADSYLKLGNIFYLQGKDSLAANDLFKSLDYYKKIDSYEGIIDSRIALAKYYKRYGRFESAKEHLQSAIYLCKNQGFLEQENEAQNILADILLIEGQFQEASNILLKTRDLADSLFNEKLIKEVTQIQMQYEFDNKMREKEFQEKAAQLIQEIKLKRVTYVRNLLVIGVILTALVLLLFIFYTRLIRKKNRLLEKQKERIANQVEMLSEQKKKLISVNSTKDKFISIIGHDLRSPFNTINGFVSLISEHYNDFDEEGVRKYLQLIRESGNNAQSLLENLLDWALSQNGEIKPQPEEVALNYLIKGNIMLVKELAAQKSIEMHENLDGAQFVTVDKNMINTVFRNLLSNAVKFTPEKGKISISTKIIGTQIKVSIQDTGIGLSSQQIKNLKEYTADKSHNSGLYTSGLGLILCKDFLTQQNIELHIDSQLGMGSEFYFYLPLVV